MRKLIRSLLYVDTYKVCYMLTLIKFVICWHL